MADIESNVKVNIDTSDALAQLKLLQQQISAFQQAMRKAGADNASAARQMQQNLVNSVNATGKFQANIQTIQTSAERFTGALEKNKLTMGEYFRYAGGASKTFGKLFKSEFDTINQVARERVKDLQTQYIKLGRDASGAMKAIAVRPLSLDMENLGTKTQITAQRQQLFNQLMKQGSTQLLNFGKNTQWAGRQLMVGFTVPLTLMGSAASKAYMEIEKASVAFRRVYGDINTTSTETEKMVISVRALANEFTKYGVAVSDTMDMAAKAAAMGKTGADLLTQISQANKLSVLGNVDQNQALETTISLTNAFGTSAEDLSSKIDFLNAVENQTVTSIEDLTIAIPKAAPVVKQLGGNVEDLAFFLTAMKEGGINASEGANALKSGLASMINPSKKASDFLAGFNINVKGIVEADKGNVKKTVIDMAKAFDTLDPLNRARAIEQMFGKFQFSRISTLFQNVIKEGSQANTVAGLANQTTEELAVLSEREMKKISDSPMYKFQKSIEDMKAKLAPVGEAFLKAVTPIIEFVSKILDGFNNLGEGSKKFITILITAVAGIGPLLLMTFGLLANGIANIMKLFTNIKGFINKTTKPSDILGEQTQYMTSEQLKSAAIASSLDQAHAKLRQTFTSETQAVQDLTAAYRNAVQAQQAFSGVPGVDVGNPNAVPPKKYANGVSMVPGPKGAGDIVPALLSPGEAVIPAKHAAKYAPVIAGMVAGNLPGFEEGTTGAGMRQSVYGPLTQRQTDGLARTGSQLKDISDEVMAGPYGKIPPTNFGTQISPTSGHSFPAFEVGGIYQKPDGTKVFVKPQIDLTGALAEVRGTEIARNAHGLIAPKQEIRVMMDPTDPEQQRRFLVLESALDERLANVPNKFSNNEYFTQLVASLLRGDKDLGIGNLGGNVLADVGPAGVFGRASGKRALGSAVNSMEEQAIINLLGVKGGAKRFFAEATSEQISKMKPAEYDAAMKSEIQKVIPKLDATIAGFGPMSPEETVAYRAMQQRLQTGLGVNWSQYQAMHSAVPPKQFAMGGVVPGYSGGTENAQSWDKTQLMHLQSAWVKDNLFKILTSPTGQIPKIQKALAESGLSNLDPTVQKMLETELLGSLVSDSSGTMNQLVRSNQKGLSPADFLNDWNSNPDQLLSSIAHGGTAINDPQLITAARSINAEIGKAAASLPTETGMIKDAQIAQATQQVLAKYAKGTDANAKVAQALMGQSDVLGEIRIRPDKNADLGTANLAEYVTQQFATGRLAFGAGAPDEGITQSVFLGNGQPWQVLPEGNKNGLGLFRIGQLDTKGRKALFAKYGSAQGIMDAFSSGQERFTNSFQNTTLRGKSGYSTKKQANIAEVIRNANKIALSSIPDGAVSDPTALAALMPGPGQKFKMLAEGDVNVGGKKSIKPKASVFDIDDTLLDLSSFMAQHQAENAKLPEDQQKKWYKEVAKDPKGIPAGLAALKAAQIRGNKILLMTARPDFYEPYTRETLEKLGIDMNGIKLIARQDKDYRKPEQMKYDKTSAYMKYYDIEEFYDDMDKTRGAISLLGIPTYNPLKLNMGGMISGYADGATSILPQGFSAMPTQAEKDAQVAFVQNSPLAQLQRGDALASLVAKSTIGKGNQMFRVPTIRQNEELATKQVGDMIDLGNRFSSIASQSELQAIGMTAAGKLNTGNRERAVNTILKLVAGYDMPGIMNHNAYNPDYKKQAFGEKGAAEYPFQSEGVLPPGMKGKITSITQNGAQRIIEVLMMKLAKGGVIPGYANGVFSVPGPKGAGDVVPAMLSPGEAVIPADKAAQHRGLIGNMISGNLPGYNKGTMGVPGYNNGMMSVPGYEFGKDNVPGFGVERFTEANPLPVMIVADATQEPSSPNSGEGSGGSQEKVPMPDGEEKQKGRHAGPTWSERAAAAGKKFVTRTPTTGKATGIAMGTSTVVGLAGMIPGKVGETAQAMMGPISAATTAMSMIPGPAGLVAGGLTLAVTATMAFIDHLNKVRDESYQLTRAMGNGNDAINKFAAFAKKVSGSEIMDKRRKESAGQFFNIVEGKTTFGESYMKTDAGKELVKSTDTAIKNGGMKGATLAITNQLSTAIAAGVMTPAQARSVAANLGIQLKNTKFGLEVSGTLTNIFGPEGENLEKDPLKVRVEMNKQSMDQFQETVKMSQTQMSTGMVDAANKTMKDAGGWGWALAFTGIGGAVGAFFTMNNYFENMAKIGGQFAGNLQNLVESQQQMVDSLQVDYDRRIGIAQAAGDTAEATRLQNQYLIDQKSLLESNAANMQVAYDTLSKQSSGLISTAKDAASTAVETAYKGSGQEGFASIAKSQLDAMKGTDVQKTMVNTLVASKQISLSNVGLMSTAFGQDEQGANNLERFAKKSPKELDRALGLAQGMGEQAGTQFLLDMSLKDPMATKQMNDALEFAQKTTGVFTDVGDTVTATAIMTYAVENPEEMIKFQQDFEKLKNQKTLTLTVIQKIVGKDITKLLGTKAVADYFGKFSGNVKKQATFVAEFQQIMAMEGDPKMIAAWHLWEKQQGKVVGFAEYAAFQADRTVRTGTDYTTDPNANKKEVKTPEPSVLDQFVGMIRNGVNWQQKLTVGWDKSLLALKRYTNESLKIMGGYLVRLQQQGIDQAIIDVFMGATEEEQNRIMNKRTGQLKAKGLELLKELKVIKDMNDYGLAYILMKPEERLAKDNELYQAGLDVISIKEKAINDKYDKRVNALNEIGKLQDQQNQSKQNEMDLADALSKGDISAAARIAMKTKQDDQRQALEDAKSSMELQRKSEINAIEIKINGLVTTKAKLEADMAINSGLIADAKLLEMDRQHQIGVDALISAEATARMLKDGRSILGLGTGGGSGTGTITGAGIIPPTPPVVAPMNLTQAMASVAKAKVFGTGMTTRAKVDATEKLTSVGYNAGEAQKANLKTQEANIVKDGYKNNFLVKDGNGNWKLKDRATIDASRKDLFDAYVKEWNANHDAQKNFDTNIAEKRTLAFNSLSPEIQAALETLKRYNDEKKTAVEAYDVQKKNFEKQAAKQLGKNKDTGDWNGSKSTDSKADRDIYATLYKPVSEALEVMKGLSTNLTYLDQSLASKGYTQSMTTFYTGKRYASGGMVSGSGTGTSDNVPAMLSNGEYVIRAKAAKALGPDTLNKINYAEKFAKGSPMDRLRSFRIGEHGAPPITPSDILKKKYQEDISKNPFQWWEFGPRKSWAKWQQSMGNSITHSLNGKVFEYGLFDKWGYRLDKQTNKRIEDVPYSKEYIDAYRVKFATGGMVYANKGLKVAASKYALGTDSIPAMLTPGEFVMKKSAVDAIGSDKLMAMNNGTSIGESVYNYSITLNVSSTSDSNEIANTVLREVKRIDSQRIRSNLV